MAILRTNHGYKFTVIIRQSGLAAVIVVVLKRRMNCVTELYLHKVCMFVFVVCVSRRRKNWRCSGSILVPSLGESALC